MSWIPLPQQEAYIKTQLAVKSFTPPLSAVKQQKENQIKAIYKLLLQAKNYKQAVAVLEAATSVKNIQDLHDYGFDALLSNDQSKIKSLFTQIPAELKKIKDAQAEQEKLNVRINDYLGLISNKYKNHQAGMHVTLPVPYDNKTDMAVKYNNGEGVLPPPTHGIYIEWYPFIGSTRSIGKRFFTHTGSSKLWYTEGGTHGNLDEWWIRETPESDWIKK